MNGVGRITENKWMRRLRSDLRIVLDLILRSDLRFGPAQNEHLVVRTDGHWPFRASGLLEPLARLAKEGEKTCRASGPAVNVEACVFSFRLSLIVITPFYAASLVESVQSEIASERPGVFDCLREGTSRLLSLSSKQMTRLLPVWKLFFPTIAYGLLHYIISSLAQYTVLVSVRADMAERKHQAADEKTVEQSIYETYYPELIATFTGNLLADTVLFPLETILHRLNLQGTRTIIDNTDTGLGVVPIITRYEGTADCFWSVMTEEGIGGLYKGFGALLLQFTIHAVLLKMTKLMFERLSDDAAPPPPVPLVGRQQVPPVHASYAGAPSPSGPRQQGGDPRYNNDYAGWGSPAGPR